MNFYMVIMNALFARQQTGKGQRVRTSQTGATLQFQRYYFQAANYLGRQRDDGQPPTHPIRAYQAPFRAGDGNLACG